MDPIVQALLNQRNTLAARNLDLELEIVHRDEKIKALETTIDALVNHAAKSETPDVVPGD